MKHRVVWTYGVPPDPNALIRMPTWNVVTAIGGIDTLRQLGLLGKANFKAAKTLNAWEYLQQVEATAKDSQVLCCFLGKYSQRKQSKLPFESLTVVRFQEENEPFQLKFGLQ